MAGGDFAATLSALPLNRDAELNSEQRLRERMLMVSLRMCGERDQAAVIECAAKFERYVIDGGPGE